MTTVAEKQKSECSGCGVCKHICPVQCIRMEADEEGFLYPRVDSSKCIECGKCMDKCPFMANSSMKRPKSVYAAQSRNEEYLTTSSSGALFPELAENILARGGIVYGVRYEEDFRVVHASVTNMDDCLSQFCNSKYIQSDLNNSFVECKKHLAAGKTVLFSGTPCQIDSLQKFLGAEANSANLITADLICYGVPSYLAFRKFTEFLEKKYNRKLKSINMRDKTLSWTESRMRAFFTDGSSEFNTDAVNLWRKLYQERYMLRPSCHACPYTMINRVGDLTLGDYWGIEDAHPGCFENTKGVSVILVNSEKGVHAVEALRSKVRIVDSSVDKCTQRQTQLQHPVPPPASIRREEFIRDMRTKSFRFVAIKYFAYGFLGRVIRRIKMYV